MNRVKKISLGLVIVAIVVTLTIVAISSSVSAERTEQRGQSDVPVPDARPATAVNTAFEEITDFGLNPQSRELEAVVSIKGLTGYNNFEFVSIWVDWNDNAVFEANELAGTTQFFATNSPAGTFLPLRYTVKIKANPPPGVTTAFFKDRRARAILSEATPPTGPAFNPVFGNIINRNVKLDPIN